MDEELLAALDHAQACDLGEGRELRALVKLFWSWTAVFPDGKLRANGRHRLRQQVIRYANEMTLPPPAENDETTDGESQDERRSQHGKKE